MGQWEYKCAGETSWTTCSKNEADVRKRRGCEVREQGSNASGDYEYKCAGETSWTPCSKNEADVRKRRGCEVRQKSNNVNTFEKCKTDLAAIAADRWVRMKDEADYNKASDTIYDKKTYLCKANNSISYHIKRKGAPNPDPNPNPDPGPGPSPRSRYQDCTGKKIRYNGCRDTDGIIHRVQGCIGVKQDNFFGPKTEAQLKLKTGKEYFTTDDVDAICSGKLTPDGGAGTTTFNWDTLIENEQIYNGGLKYETKDGTEVYIIKRELNTDKKLPLDTLSGANPEKFDYFVYFPIPQGQTRGNYGKLIFYTTPNGERKVKVDKNQNWKWEPEENIESFDVMEDKIKNILDNILSEQKHYGGPADRRSSELFGNTSSGTPSGTSSGTPSGTSSGTPGFGTGSTKAKPNPNDVKTIVEPLRLETIELLNQIKKNLKFMLAASEEDKKGLDDAITLLNNFDSSKACDSIALIDENLKFLNQMIEANEGDFGKKDIINLAKQIRTNLEKVKSECSRLEKEAQQIQNQSVSTTNQPTSSTPTGGKPTSGGESNQSELNQQTGGVDCSIEKLVQYIIDGLQGVKNISQAIKTQREDLCYCYKTGKFNDYNSRSRIGDLFKKKVESNVKTKIDKNVAPDKQLSRLLDKKLSWNEATKLIQGGTVNGVTLSSNYVDGNFGTEACKATIVKESTKSVKDMINEAVNQKRNNKSKIGSLISEAVVAKRKEKTRDVIAEDLIKMIKGY